MFVRSILAVGVVTFGLAACADPALTQKVADLEKKVQELETKAAQAPAPRGPGAGPQAEAGDPAKEQAARDQITKVQEKVAGLDWDGARALCSEGAGSFGDTQMWRRGGRICDEVAVVGKDVSDLEVEKWFQGDAKVATGGATLLVFWEQWCPHCKREVPKVEETYAKYKGRMNVVGLTKVNRSSTDEKVAEFIKEHKLSYPVAKEKDGNWSEYFGVSGVPAAAIVKDGKVVWRGHPARLSDETIDKML
jgi:thiol-disulfide isomerase/thioredoxin